MGIRKVLLFCLLLAVFTCLVVSAFSDPSERHRRPLLQDADMEEDDEDELVLSTKKKIISASLSSSKNNTKPIKLSSSKESSKSQSSDKLISPSKNQTKLTKFSSGSVKNKTKTSSSDLEGDGYSYSLGKTKLKKLNSTKPSSIPAKKFSDLLKTSSSSKNKTSKYSINEHTQLATEKTKKKKENNETQNQNLKKQQITKTPSQPSWIYTDDDDDLVSDFRDLPTKFQKTIIPDLKKISSSSKTYLSQANKEITKGFKPYVGNKYAPKFATAISFTFIIIPFFLVSLLFTRIKPYFSLQKLLISTQLYLSIYFFILCLSSLATGLEPLRVLYATSRSTYGWLQILQTLGYALYLLLLVMYLVLVFSTDSGPRSRLLGLAQMILGLAVGLHYYVTVFHRMVLRQPPKTSWKVHAMYATCFLVICLLAGADRRKRTYLGDGGEEGKKS